MPSLPIDSIPPALSLEMLWLLMVQNDRLYQERHEAAKLALINAFTAQQAALDNASKASDAAIKHEHEVIEARIGQCRSNQHRNGSAVPNGAVRAELRCGSNGRRLFSHPGDNDWMD